MPARPSFYKKISSVTVVDSFATISSFHRIGEKNTNDFAQTLTATMLEFYSQQKSFIFYNIYIFYGI